MEHIAAFMILIACGDGFVSCSEQPAPAVGYESLQQCETELSPAIRMIAVADRQTLGKCVEIDPALFYEDAEIVWDVTRQGEIEVAVELINPEMSVQTLAQSGPAPETSRMN